MNQLKVYSMESDGTFDHCNYTVPFAMFPFACGPGNSVPSFLLLGSCSRNRCAQNIHLLCRRYWDGRDWFQAKEAHEVYSSN